MPCSSRSSKSRIHSVPASVSTSDMGATPPNNFFFRRSQVIPFSKFPNTSFALAVTFAARTRRSDSHFDSRASRALRDARALEEIPRISASSILVTPVDEANETNAARGRPERTRSTHSHGVFGFTRRASNPPRSEISLIICGGNSRDSYPATFMGCEFKTSMSINRRARAR